MEPFNTPQKSSSNLDLTGLIEQAIESLFERMMLSWREPDDDSRRNVPPLAVQMDKEIEAYTLIIQRAPKRRSACQTRRNSVALINGLPKDVTYVVLNWAVKGWKPMKFYYTKLFALRLVCKAWDAFIREHSSFWALAYPGLPDELHQITIPRSRNHPLQIRYPGAAIVIRGRGGGSRRRSRCDRFLTQLLTERWPVKYFSFNEYDPDQVVDEDSPIHTLLASPAPQLETLDLHMPHQINDLFSGDAPALRRVSLEGLVLGAGIQALSNLRILELREVHGLNTAEILQILSQSPGLEDLRIWSRQSIPEPLVEPPTSALPLNHLHTLKFNHVCTTFISTLVHAISIPPTTAISLTWHPNGAHGSDEDFRNLVQAMLNQRPTKKVHVGYYLSHGLKIEGQNWKVAAEVLDEPWNGPINSSQRSEYFSRMVPTGVRALVVAFEFVGNRIVDPMITAIDSAFPSIPELHVELRQYGDDFHFHSLTEPTDTTISHPRWLCPRLRKLTLVQHDHALAPLEAVMEVVEARSRSAADNSQAAPNPLAVFVWKTASGKPTPQEVLALLAKIRTIVLNVVISKGELDLWEWPHTEGWNSRSDRAASWWD